LRETACGGDGYGTVLGDLHDGLQSKRTTPK